MDLWLVCGGFDLWQRIRHRYPNVDSHATNSGVFDPRSKPKPWSTLSLILFAGWHALHLYSSHLLLECEAHSRGAPHRSGRHVGALDAGCHVDEVCHLTRGVALALDVARPWCKMVFE